MGETLKIRRAVSTDVRDDFVVKVIQINHFFDFVILEGNEEKRI